MGVQTTFYSIGENCLVHGLLVRHRKNLAATPFSHGLSNIDYLTQIVQTNFEGFLDEKNLRYDTRYKKQIVINTSYTCEDGLFASICANSFEFTHHDILADPKAMDSYQRKIERFQDSPHGEGVACFLYHSRAHKGQELGRLTEKLRSFRDQLRRIATRPVTLAMFTQREVASEAERGIDFSRLNDIPVAVLRTRHIWKGADNDVFWGKSDDDLFAPMIGAFEFDAVTNAMPEEPAQARQPLLARIWPRSR